MSPPLNVNRALEDELVVKQWLTITWGAVRKKKQQWRERGRPTQWHNDIGDPFGGRRAGVADIRFTTPVRRHHSVLILLLRVDEIINAPCLANGPLYLLPPQPSNAPVSTVPCQRLLVLSQLWRESPLVAFRPKRRGAG